MTDSQEKTRTSRTLGNKLWWLILGRLALALLLFLVGPLWSGGGGPHLSQTKTISLLSIVGLTLLYSLARLFSKAFLFQARCQFLIDVILVTWLIWNSDVI